jgi:amino acid transporter
VAGEMTAAGRNYLRAITIALPAVALGYLLPLAVALPATAATAQWRTGWFAVEGARIGGPLLGAAVSIGGAISAAAMFSAALLWVSRLPFVLAGEGYLPRGLARIWAGRQVPGRSIVVCCVVLSILLPLSFMTLVVLDVFFYMLALILEMWALVRLRRLHPNREGLFVIGKGRLALYAVVAAPIVTWLASLGFALKSGEARDLITAIVLGGCAWPAYVLLRRLYGGTRGDTARRCS